MMPTAPVHRHATVAGLAFVFAVSVALLRAGLLTEVEGVRLRAHWILVDFYNAGYYPARTLLEGVNPHNRDRFLADHPVPDTYPPYSPVNLLVHLPFALLPCVPAGILYFASSSLLVLPLAYWGLQLAGVRPR